MVVASPVHVNQYQPILDLTHGVGYPSGQMFDAQKMLADYAQRIAFRAVVHAHKRVKLSKTPLDVASIKVTLDGKVLPAADYSYDATTNELVLRWDLMNQGQMSPGDALLISYRVS